MELTNVLNLPQPFIDAIKADDYDRGNADFSVSELTAPSQKVLLKRKHWDEIVEDASDKIFALLGKSVHAILEKHTSNELNAIAEQRLFIERHGIRVSGQFDFFCLDDKILYDYKTMSVWEYIYGLNEDRVQQLNLYNLILEENGYGDNVEQLKVVGIFRDWSKPEVRRRKAAGSKYPERQIVLFPVPKWSKETQEKFIEDRVALLKLGGKPCTDAERWYKPGKWAVIKINAEKASRLLDSEREAVEYQRKYMKSPSRIEFRKGSNNRCEDYCEVKDFCEQYKSFKEI